MSIMWLAVAAVAAAAIGAVTAFAVVVTAKPRPPARTVAGSDTLTGVGTRDGFLTALDHPDGPAAVILINVDHSRTLITQVGDRAFDQLLVLVGARIAQIAARVDGALFRMRRDEFAVIVDAGTADPVRVAEAVVAAVAEPTDLHLERRTVTVTVTACAGIATTAAASTGAGAGRIVLAHADTALRHAKSIGRGRIASIADAVRRQPSPGPRPPTRPRPRT